MFQRFVTSPLWHAPDYKAIRSTLQQRPHHTHEVMSGRHQGDLLALRIATLSTLEIRAHSWRTTQRLPGRLGDQLANDRRAFAGNVPQSVLVARLVLTRNQSEIGSDCLGMEETMWIIHGGS